MKEASLRHSDGEICLNFPYSLYLPSWGCSKACLSEDVAKRLNLGDLLSDFTCLILDGIYLSVFPDIFPSLPWLRSQPWSSWSPQALRNRSLLFISYSPWKDLKCSFNIQDHMNLYEKSKVCQNEESAWDFK